MTEMKRLIFICLAFLAFLTGGGDTLWWLVDDTANVDGTPIADYFLNNYPEDDIHSAGARLVAIGSDGSRQVVPVAFPVEDGFPPMNEIYLGYDEDGRFTTGNWASQSPLGGLDAELYREAKFMIELGYMTWDDMFNVVDWVSLAQSDEVAKQDLSKYIWNGWITPPADGQWTPVNYHTTPEPSTAILCIIGFGMLMLRRKHPKWENG